MMWQIPPPSLPLPDPLPVDKCPLIHPADEMSLHMHSMQFMLAAAVGKADHTTLNCTRSRTPSIPPPNNHWQCSVQTNHPHKITATAAQPSHAHKVAHELGATAAPPEAACKPLAVSSAADPLPAPWSPQAPAQLPLLCCPLRVLFRFESFQHITAPARLQTRAWPLHSPNHIPRVLITLPCNCPRITTVVFIFTLPWVLRHNLYCLLDGLWHLPCCCVPPNMDPFWH